MTLTAAPGPGSVVSWSGCDIAPDGVDVCTVALDGPRTVTAVFAPAQLTLTVANAGSGSGSVTSLPAGIDCGAVCVADFDHDALVELTATPADGMVFQGWSGARTGAGSCIVTMSADASVTATFDIAPSPTTLAESDPAVAYDGWRGVVDPTASGGTYRVNSTKGQVLAWVSPAATSITWIARTGPNLGRASVSIDGVSKGTVDLYAPTPGGVSRTYSALTSAAHTVTIKVAGTKNAASIGTAVTHDAFVAGATTTQESAPGVRYASWTGTSHAAATDGAYRSSATKAATVTVPFSGTAIDWITTTGKPYGKASVTIDGVSKGTVDLYAAVTTWQVTKAFDSLTPGPHTMVIKALGTKNAAATGTSVVIDGFVVHP